MIIAIGSTNPVKVRAAREAVQETSQKLGWYGDLDFRNFNVPSGVSSQPFSDEETKLGARNRAKQCLAFDPEAHIGFGLEGGVVPLDDGLYSTVWICVVDREGKERLVNGARFKLNDDLVQLLHSGIEMGDAMDQLCERQGIRQTEGMIGVYTNGVITRTDEYKNLAHLAFALYAKDVGLG